MATTLKVVVAQLNFTVGDVSHNAQKIIAAIEKARDELKADIIIFPELAISGYPPEDLLYRAHFYTLIDQALEDIKKCVSGIDAIIGYPEKTEKGVFNSAIWIRDGKAIVNYRKQKLPNYSVFDECRYFITGDIPCVVNVKGIRCAILICEDVWYPEPVAQAKKAGARCIFCINSSPYSIPKANIRHDVLRKRVIESELPIFYINTVGGQDELIFEGDSQVMNAKGEVCAHAGYFEEQLLLVEVDSKLNITKQPLPPSLSRSESVYQALLLGIRDYVHKNHFPGVVIAVSGGIDSSLTLALAVDALGADKVTALLMPSQYTAKISLEDAKAEAELLGVRYHIIPIQHIFELFLETLKNVFTIDGITITEENIQARIRAILLMAVSNKTGKLVLSTGNKSEMSMGYATLYGDMVGGFCVLKDVFKTLVYELANYRNSLSPVICERSISRTPSAELAPDQTDQDVLPPYDVLDPILELFVEQDRSIEEIIQKGFDEVVVKKIVKMVVSNEYKRRQAPPGIRITEKAFGRDRRYPITSEYLKSLD